MASPRGNRMKAKTQLRYVAGRDWKESAEIALEALRDETLGELLDGRLREIASELTVLEVLRSTYFDEVEDRDFYEDVHDGKPLEKWVVKLVKAIKRGPIEWPGEND